MTFGSTFGRTFSPTFQPKSQAKKGGVVVYDEFTDTNGTALSSHTPNLVFSGGWSSTNLSINGNKVVNSAYGTARIETGIADGIVSGYLYRTADYSRAIYQNTAITVRWGASGYTTGWHIDIYSNKFCLIEQVGSGGGDYYERAYSNKTISLNTPYFVEIILAGSTITATIDGGNQISYSSAELNKTSTSHGMRLCGGSASALDTFTVTAI